MAKPQAQLEQLPHSRDDALVLPNLIEVQTNSYQRFLQQELRDLFHTFSPIEDYTGKLSLEFLDYRMGPPQRTLEECQEADVTYEAPLYVKVRLVNKETGEIKESEVYMGELPQMTEGGTFLINGAERVVISQLARSPGVYFKDTIDSAGRVLYAAQVIPSQGVWVDITSAATGAISVKIGQTRRFPITTLLRALDWFEDSTKPSVARTGTDTEILEYFGEHQHLEVQELLNSFSRPEDQAMPRVETHDVYYALDAVSGPEDEAMIEPYQYIDEKAAKTTQEMGRKRLRVIAVPYQIHATLHEDNTHTAQEALLEVYRKIRPGDPPTEDSAAGLLTSYFFDSRRYDLSRVGRYKTNQKLGLEVPYEVRGLTRLDLLAIIKYLLKLFAGEGSIDDIDHLQNKRVRAVGELLQSQLQTGFFRMEQVARERMTSLEPEDMIPAAIISIKPITAAVNSFFGSGQLSQFMDQINPLAELAHKRRLSALGPGGLSRQSAKLEVRDVHYSHYGRICPIETPEGPNVGLIGYLALYAKLNEFGFIETPYYKVVNGRVTDEACYLTAAVEEKCNIATTSEPLDEQGRLLADRITVRRGGGFPQVPPQEVAYRDGSAHQVFSIATALIPFLENNDAVRALAGSNMQRQAVPLLMTEQPYIKTGRERSAAYDSGAVIVAEQDGEVLTGDANHLQVKYADGSEKQYRLQKFRRTNMGTCTNQKLLVAPGESFAQGTVLVDGGATRNGELALGKNLLVAFMPWEGYNYEDAVVISERIVQQDVLSSIHIEKFDCEARDTKLGPEEITRDIPNVGDEPLKDLDENGVVRVGAEVGPEDILVGKVAPKGQAELTAEEKLVIAIFGKKAEEMRDVSLRMPYGQKGIVIDTRIFSRFRYRCRRCEAEFAHGKQLEYLECERCGGKLEKLGADELKPGGNQMVRVFVAQRRKVAVGDKLTGRHGNKGVIAKIVPAEDMPYLPDGTPVDMCLNPLSVPSRMNIGQILETHLGGVAHHLGQAFTCPVFEGFSSEQIRQGMRQVQQKLCYESLKDYAQCELNRFERVIDLSDFNGATPEELQVEITRQLSQYDKQALEPLAQWLGIEPRRWGRADDGQVTELIIQTATDNAYSAVQFDPETGRAVLYDGRTGEPFDQMVAVGYMYTLKRPQLAEYKLHARSTGPYSLITQQPLGGKAQMGGQRFGEMEVWALEAYGAAYTLQEMLTIKSDDVQGRVQAYEAIVKDENIKESGIPESFKILIREMQSLGLDVQVAGHNGQIVDLSSDSDSL